MTDKRIILFLTLVLGFLSAVRKTPFVVALDHESYLWAMNMSYSTVWLRIWEAITALGEGYFVYPLVAMPAIVFLASQRSRPAVWYVVLMIFLFCLSPVLKNIFQYPRPVSLSPYTDLLTYSYPSGHAVNAVVMFYFLPRFAARVFGNPKSWRLTSPWIAMSGTTLVAGSRVILGVHWLADVLAGVVLGALISILLLKIFEKISPYSNSNQ